MKTLSIEMLHELLSYNPLTGILIWKTRSIEHFRRESDCRIWNTRYSGKIAGAINAKGYLQVTIHYKLYYCHRIAWAMYYGVWPINQIDHENEVKSDNWIDNLREATNGQNQQNAGNQINNKSGFKGVCWNKRDSNWLAQIMANGVHYNLGAYPTAILAAEAYAKAAKELHKEFANLGEERVA